MKSTSPSRHRWSWGPVACALAAALGLGAAGAAEGPPSSRAEPERKPAPRQERQGHITTPQKEKRIITGSHIPRELKRMGQTADTPFPIHILDSRDIERSGAATVAEALRRVPAVR